MTNPASALLQIMTEWRDAGEGAQVDTRLIEHPSEGVPSVRRHVTAMAYIDQIYTLLDQFEARGFVSVYSYREAARAWSLTVLCYPYGWQAPDGSTVNTFHLARLDMLEALSGTIDLAQPQIDATQLTSFEVYLKGIVELLDEDKSLSDELRAYILKLVHELRAALETWTVTGSFVAEERVTQLWVALTAASAQSKASKRKWQGFADSIIKPASAQLLAGVAVQAAGTAMDVYMKTHP